MIRIAIVIQSADFTASAGMRIRYQRFMKALAPGAAQIDVVQLDELACASSFAHDAYVFCKTFTPDAQILAHYLHRAGKVVGQDIFDDYFSQAGDPRLARYRAWLQGISPETDYAVCSTMQMRSVLTQYLNDVPVTVIGDPVEAYDPLLVSQLSALKIERMQRTRRIDVLWFGIGDNPFFSVGLRDLAALAGRLGVARRADWSINLKVLTNSRATAAEGLARLRRIAVPFEIAEWSESAEDAALRAADVCFLPVNAQAFSRAKSLNRALTALSRGCQVLSPGFPLYAELDQAIYASSQMLLADLEAGRPRLRPETVPALTDLLAKIANPYAAAAAFVDAARAARDGRVVELGARKKSASGPSLCVLHGRDSPSQYHKLATRLRALSVKSPFNTARLNFHIRFEPLVDRMDVLVEESTAALVAPKVRGLMREAGKVLDKTFLRLPGQEVGLGADLPYYTLRHGAMVAQLSSYQRVMQDVAAACRKMFPGVRVLVVENSNLAQSAVAALKA